MKNITQVIIIIKFIINHPLTKNNRFSSITKFFVWQILSTLTKSCIIFPWVNDSKLSLKKGESGLSGNLYVGLIEFNDMAFLIHALRSETLFVDVGANMGAYTVLASKVCNCKTIAYEPISDSFFRLLDQINLNKIGHLVSAKKRGVSFKNEILYFTNHLNAMNKVISSQDKYNSEMVDVVSLDSEIQEPTSLIVKIDVEGFEYNVLKGCTQLLYSKSIIAIIIEINKSCIDYGHTPDDIHNHIVSFGYIPIKYNPFQRKVTLIKFPSFGYGNTIYVRDLIEIQNLVENGMKFKIKSANDILL